MQLRDPGGLPGFGQRHLPRQVAIEQHIALQYAGNGHHTGIRKLRASGVGKRLPKGAQDLRQPGKLGTGIALMETQGDGLAIHLHQPDPRIGAAHIGGKQRQRGRVRCAAPFNIPHKTPSNSWPIHPVRLL